MVCLLTKRAFLRRAFVREDGFTLVELVTVILLLGILATVALPRFFNKASYDYRGFQDTAAADIRFAQKLARFSGCDTRVEITAGGYTLTQRLSCSSGAFSVPVPRIGAAGDAVAETAPSGLTLTPADFYFDSLGSPRDNPGGALRTSSLDLAIGGDTLRIEADTGYTHWL